MDFIERIFGVSPDGGTGTTEAILVATLAASAALIYSLLRRKKSGKVGL